MSNEKNKTPDSKFREEGAERQLDDFTVFQTTNEGEIDHKAYEADPIAGGEENAILSDPLMALGLQVEQDSSSYTDNGQKNPLETKQGEENTSISNAPFDITTALVEENERTRSPKTAEEGSKDPSALSITQTSTLPPIPGTSDTSLIPQSVSTNTQTQNTQTPNIQAREGETRINTDGTGNETSADTISSEDVENEENTSETGPENDTETDNDTETNTDNNTDTDTDNDTTNEDIGTDTGGDTDTGTETDNNTAPGNSGNTPDNKGHGNNLDGVDDDNPGQGAGGPNAEKTDTVDEDEGALGNQDDPTPGADPNPDTGTDNDTTDTDTGTDTGSDTDTDTETDNDTAPGNSGNTPDNKGHGNNLDGVDDDNPGQGAGGPNAGKTDTVDEDEGALGNQDDPTPGADPNPDPENNTTFFDMDESNQTQDNTQSWLDNIDETSTEETSTSDQDNTDWLSQTDDTQGTEQTTEQDSQGNSNNDKNNNGGLDDNASEVAQNQTGADVTDMANNGLGQDNNANSNGFI